MGHCNPYTITIVNTLQAMAGLAKPWRELLAQSRSNSIFLTWEWLYTWTECFLDPHDQLFVLLVHKEGELIGIAPWQITGQPFTGHSLKAITFLGLPEAGSDYLDVFAKRGREKEVASQIYSFLKKSTHLWDCVLLKDIASESLFLLHFTNGIEDEGKYAELQYGHYCPSVLLPKSIEAFRAQLSANRRQQFARHLRLLGREGRIDHQVYRSEEARLPLKDLFVLYDQRWGKAEKLSYFIDQFAARSEHRDWLQVDILRVNGRDVAGLVHLRYQNTLSMYLMAVDLTYEKSISIGNILVGLSIERAITEGFGRYDFLRGTEDYKFHWSNEGRREVHLYWCGRKPKPFLWMAGRSMRALVKVAIR